MFKKLIILYIGLLVSASAYAQPGSGHKDDEKKNDIIERRIELIDTEDSDVDFTSLFDALNTFYDSPINLNNSSVDELRELYLLSDIQINSLLDHIDKNGKLLNIYELQAIRGFDLELINNILPFVKVGGGLNQSRLDIKTALKNGKHDLFLRYMTLIEESKGSKDISEEELALKPNSRYLGGKERIYMRYRFKFHNHISFGVTGEKDSGEEFFTGTQKNGFDFYSAHLYVADYGKVKRAVVGDYLGQFGQGLTFWSGRAFGKSIDLLSIKKNPRGIRPYTSVDENQFLRGAGTTIKLGKLDLSLLASFKKIDANVTLDTIDSQEFVFISLQQSGIHNTINSFEDKDLIDERMLVANLNYNTRQLSVGATVAQTAYINGFERKLGVYNKFEFNDVSNLNMGIDYNYTVKNINIFGEISQSKNGAKAYLQGLLMALDKDLSLVALYRHYDRGFHGINSVGISENSRNINETGLLIGIESKFAKRWKLAGYLDRFKFPWLKFQVDAPSVGHEGIAQLTWKPKRGTELYFRYKNKTKSKNTKEDVAIDYITPKIQNSYRFNFSFKVTDAIRLKSRVEWNTVEIEGDVSHGYMAFQDLTYKALSSPFSFSLRYALFDSETYDSRIYAYENEILYFYSIPAYYSRGSRYYISTKYRISRNIDMWLRWSQWIYDDKDKIGTGLNEIDGNSKSEIKLQLRFKF